MTFPPTPSGLARNVGGHSIRAGATLVTKGFESGSLEAPDRPLPVSVTLLVHNIRVFT